MENLRNYIVVNDGQFEAVSLAEQPLNMALREPNFETRNNRYVLINNNVSIAWVGYTNFLDRKRIGLRVNFKEKELYFLENASIQEALDVLNKYKNISEVDLNKLIIEIKQEEKSLLELEIERLKKEKDILIKESKVYKEIINKGSELFSLIKGLE